MQLTFRWMKLMKAFKNVSSSHFTLKLSQSVVANTHTNTETRRVFQISLCGQNQYTGGVNSRYKGI